MASEHETTAAGDPNRQRLKAFFSSTPDVGVARRWDDMWKAGDFLPFDRGTPNPALDEALQRHLALPGHNSALVSDRPPASTAGQLGSPLDLQETETQGVLGGKRPKNANFEGRWMALVPGCGRGYDVLLLAAYGFHAVGLEFSETAVRRCEELRAKVDAGLRREGGVEISEEQLAPYRTRDEHLGRGTATYVTGDFFSDAWTTDENGRLKFCEEWDLVYDYTFLSALPPSVRPKWAARMRDLVRRDGGRLLCVEFPTYKDPKTGGPPWGLPSVVYLAHLGRPGHDVQYDQEGHAVLSDGDANILKSGEPVDVAGMVRIAHWKAERTHPVGKDTDHVGIWRRADGA